MKMVMVGQVVKPFGHVRGVRRSDGQMAMSLSMCVIFSASISKNDFLLHRFEWRGHSMHS